MPLLFSKASKADCNLDQMHNTYHGIRKQLSTLFLFFLIFHLEPNVTNIEWTHHHRKHATLVDMVGHFHHTQQSAQLALPVF